MKVEKLSLKLQEKYIIKDEGVNMSKDGNFYVCKTCYENIRNGKAKSVQDKDLLELSSFPNDLLEEVKKVSKVDEVLLNNIENLDLKNPEKLRKRYEHDALMLNKLESFILKLVIPFVRVAHCKRGRYMMVKGNLVLISNDIEHSMAKLLPSEQHLLPVSFKRKMEYKGSFLEEWIDTEKVKKYFQWFKKHNPLYRDVELSEELIEKFEQDALSAGKEYEDFVAEAQQEFNSDLRDEIFQSDADDSSSDNDDDSIPAEPIRNVGNMEQTSMFCDKYETDVTLPTVANRMADIIVDYEKNRNIVENLEDDFDVEFSSLYKGSDKCADDVIYWSDDETDDLEEDSHNIATYDILQSDDDDDNIDKISCIVTDEILSCDETKTNVINSVKSPVRKSVNNEKLRKIIEPNKQESNFLSNKSAKRFEKINRKMEKVQIAPGEFGEFKN